MFSKKILKKLQLIREILVKFHTSTLEQVLELIMEPIEFSNISSQITQRSHQITGQTRWHLVDTDKTYLQ